METTPMSLVQDRVGTDGRVARLTLNRPEKLNALSQGLLLELRDALRALEADESVRVIVLRGAGRSFSVGYDLSERPRGPHPRFRDEKGRKLMVNFRTALQEIADIQIYYWNLAKVTIAQVHGHCLAGGCELAMMSDLVVAADDARLGHPGVRGLGVPRNGLIWPLVIGMRKAKELCFSGDDISGVEAAAIGMVNYAWPGNELDARTVAFADRIATISADHLAVLKLSINRFYENMGIYSSIRSATDLDALAQQTEQAYAYGDEVRKASEDGGGFRQAVEWRDRPYREKRHLSEP